MLSSLTSPRWDGLFLTMGIALWVLRCFITDIDECSESTDDCSHVCVNTVGSYQCTCSEMGEGSSDLLTLAADGKTCLGLSDQNIEHILVSRTTKLIHWLNLPIPASCPDDYISSPRFQSCYKVFTPMTKFEASDHKTAETKCQSDHHSSHLASADTGDELEFYGALLVTQPGEKILLV